MNRTALPLSAVASAASLLLHPTAWTTESELADVKAQVTRHFGLGHGSGAHAPDEYYVIESSNPKIAGFDDAIMFYIEYLYQLAK